MLLRTDSSFCLCVCVSQCACVCSVCWRDVRGRSGFRVNCEGVTVRKPPHVCTFVSLAVSSETGSKMGTYMEEEEGFGANDANVCVAMNAQ